MSLRTAWVAIAAVTWLAATWLGLLGGCGVAGSAGDVSTSDGAAVSTDSPSSSTAATTRPPDATASSAPGQSSGTSLEMLSTPVDGLASEIRGLLGDSGVPIYLPGRLPVGYEPATPGDPTQGADNPTSWPMGGTRPGPRAAGYAVLYADGSHLVRLDVNPAADLGDVQWVDAAMPGAYGPLRTTTAAGVMWVGVPNGDGMEIVVSGDSALAPTLLAVAAEVTRFQGE